MNIRKRRSGEGNPSHVLFLNIQNQNSYFGTNIYHLRKIFPGCNILYVDQPCGDKPGQVADGHRGVSGGAEAAFVHGLDEVEQGGVIRQTGPDGHPHV